MTTRAKATKNIRRRPQDYFVRRRLQRTIWLVVIGAAISVASVALALIGSSFLKG